MNYINEPHIFAFCWIMLIGGFSLTVSIMRNPCEDPRQAIMFYLAIPFITAMAILSLPWAYHKTIEVLWTDQIKKKRLQVKRR